MFDVVRYVVLAGSVAFGLVLWTASELPLILREIAFNTRKAIDNENLNPRYAAVTVLSTVMQVIAILVVIAGLIYFFLIGDLGDSISEMLY